MAGEFYYNPGVSDQRAEIISRAAPVIAANLARGAQSLGQNIQYLKQQHDTLKAKKALGEAYADSLGLDPKTVDKMKLPQLDAFLTLAPSRIGQRQQQNQASILGSALGGLFGGGASSTGGVAPGIPGARSPGQLGAAAGSADGTQPRSDLGAAFVQALSRAGAAGATPDTMSALGNLGKTISAMYNRGMTVDPATGLRMYNGRPLPAATQKLLGFGPDNGGGTPNGIQFTPGPGGTSFWNLGNRGGEVRPTPSTTRPESFGYGPFPKGTTFGASNGVRTATTPDGQTYVLPGGGNATPGNDIIDSTINGTPPPKAGGSTTGTLKPTDEDVAYLKAHPEQAAAFDNHFGAGSAKQYLDAE